MKTSFISILVLTAMIVGANTASASRARNNVFGSNDNGFILNGSGMLATDDMYNIFYNPAYVNDFKNWVIVEKGSKEGGFVTSMGSLNMGLFMDRSDAFSKTQLGTTGSNPTTATNYGDRPIDFTIGGDNGVKWGIGGTYASSRGTTLGKSTNLTGRLGLEVADFAPFVNYRLVGNSTTSTTVTKDKDMTFGVKYTYGDWTPFVAYRNAKQKSAGAITFAAKSYILGVGRDAKLGENARLIYNVSLGQLVDKATSTTNSKRTIVPVNVGIEADVASWITIRGGVQYRLMDKTSGTTAAGTNSFDTVARVGASFHVNKVSIDWNLGSNNGTTTNGTAVDSRDESQAGFDGKTFTDLSVAYRW